MVLVKRVAPRLRASRAGMLVNVQAQQAQTLPYRYSRRQGNPLSTHPCQSPIRENSRSHQEARDRPQLYFSRSGGTQQPDQIGESVPGYDKQSIQPRFTAEGRVPLIAARGRIAHFSSPTFPTHRIDIIPGTEQAARQGDLQVSRR